MSAPVQLVFLGEVLAGFRLEDVQRELGRLLKTDEARLKSVFSGRRTVLKRNLAAAEAERYVVHLAKLGARVHVEPMAPAAAAPEAWPTIAPPEEAAAPRAPRETADAAASAAAVAERPPIPAAPPPPAPPVAAAAPRATAKELALQPLESEAEEQIVCPTCGERQSKRILCRACATNMPMGIAAKLEEEERRRAERQALLEERRGQRRGGARAADSGERSAWPVGFSFAGRVGRLSSVNTNLWLLTALLLLSVGFLQRPSLPRMLLLGAGMLAVFFFSMRLTVLRLHDCDRHGWWALFVLVPYVGSLASLLIAAVPGNADANEYGPPPPKGRWRWFFVALLALAASGVMMVRAGIGFAERIAAEQKEDDTAEEMMDLGSGNTGGGSGVGSAGLQDAFRDYMGAPGHKAFAASSRQTYAWVGSAGSVDEAARSALSQCDARRQAYTPRCRVVHVNGQPVN
jgi:uncharacterized membrane protein YhaH (DUF805 family)